MALKSRITDKAEFDKLNDAIKAEYKEENGVWLLQSDDAEDVRRAKDREKTRADDAERELARIKKEKDDAENARAAAEQAAADEKARKAGDIATIEKSWETKLNNAVATETAKVEKLTSQLNKALKTGKAEALAAEISTIPEVLAPLIEARLDVDLSGDEAIVRILDTNRKPSALSFDELKKEFVDNKRFASIIKGTNASGGGANNDDNSGGGAPDGKKIKDMNEQERIAYHRRDAEGYKRQAMSEGITVGMS